MKLTVPLVVLFVALAWTAFRAAGVDQPDWNLTLIIVSSLAVWVLNGSRAPRMKPWLAWPLILVPAWVLFQLLPLPAILVRIVSPARAELAAALGPRKWIPLSAYPAMTLAGWLRVAGCVLIFLLVRELAWRCSRRRTCWPVVAPLVAVAFLEAAVGLLQIQAGEAGAVARGTYHNRNHFAALMEMALPFPVMYGYRALRLGIRRVVLPVRSALVACGSFGCAAVILLGAIQSMSRMGFAAALLALAVMGAAQLPRKRWLLAVLPAILLLFVFLPPMTLIERFSDFSSGDSITSQDRLKVWRESLPMVSAYWAAGSGLETFQYVFPRYKRHAPTIVDNFAHNDYLQYLVELGVFAFVLVLLAVGGVVGTAVRAAFHHSSSSGRALAVATVASLSAVLLHSFVDFNTYIPANAAAFAWIAAIAVSVMYSSAPRQPNTN